LLVFFFNSGEFKEGIAISFPFVINFFLFFADYSADKFLVFRHAISLIVGGLGQSFLLRLLVQAIGFWLVLK